MKKLSTRQMIVLIFIALISMAGCARKAIPSRIEQLKAERAEALRHTDSANNNLATTHHSRHNRKLPKPKSSKEQKKEEVDLEVIRDSTKYYDANYANYVYTKLAAAYADTISALPSTTGKDVNYAKDFVGSVNFNLRKPQFVIIHHTSQDSVNETLRTFTLERTQVSANYLIGRDGTVHHMVNDYLRAWQAGQGKWGNITDMNSCSVGIELDNDGFEPFTDKQINSLLAVLENLKERFNIPTANFIGHADYAPNRKNDPNVNFPWKLLAGKGFGLWWDDTTNVVVPKDFNEFQALRIIGYDVHDVGKAIIAFRRHFCGIDSEDTSLSPEERKVLYMLYTKYI
ncbi:N-acetylmuramoyl-L-alanine amidase [Arachidicoccus sp.]|uniref:N-acetylmuramoyl-L-alanine amidase n=1 Tax=Arachidicoccus sp. TaxID=1872624 RepID=UPI003D1B607A